MKTMLALAIVGFLSLSSLAENKELKKEDINDLPSKRESFQPQNKNNTTDELSQESCPEKLKMIESHSARKFCISRQLQPQKTKNDAIQDCKNLIGPHNSHGLICNKVQMESACSFENDLDKIDKWVWDPGKPKDIVKIMNNCKGEYDYGIGSLDEHHFLCCISW